MKYKDFLKTKQDIIDQDSGFDAKDKLLNPSLFDFQRDIVKWSIRKGRSAIFADCGLGKTVMQLEWAQKIFDYTKESILILAPLAVNRQTYNEGKKFGIDVNLCESQEDVKKGINITNYQKLHKFDPSKFIGIVLDESSILKSFSGKYRAEIIKKFESTSYKLACTATPAPNDYMELGNHSEFLGIMKAREMLATFFVHDGRDVSKWRIKGYAEEEFWKWICSWAVYIRKPSDLEYDDNGFKIPDLKINNIILRSNEKPKKGFFNLLANTLDERRDARKNSIDQRIQAAKELIDKKRDESWLLWCNFNKESEEASKKIGGIEITGSNSDEIKSGRMIDFSNGKIKHLVTKPSIAGFGMNWQHCNNIIFLGLSDSYEQFYQAIRRCWRFGQKKHVNAYIIITNREINVLKNIDRKSQDAERMALAMLDHMKDLNKKAVRGFRKETQEYKTDKKSGENYDMYLGDSCEIIKDIKDNTIHYSIFSPPFLSLYTYSNSERDLGNCRRDEDFYKHFMFLIKELYRVTKTGRLLSFHCMNVSTTKGREGYIGLKDFRGELIRLFQEVGFIYHSEVTIWKNPAIEMQRTKALGLLHKQLKKDASKCRMGSSDYIVTMRKQGENLEPIVNTKETFGVEKWREWASPVWMDINPSNTLQYRSARAHKDDKHITPLQLEVIERCIRLWSNPGDVVLSPFAGIGSEGHCALRLGRKFIGIELKESYYNQAWKNLYKAAIQNKKGFMQI